MLRDLKKTEYYPLPFSYYLKINYYTRKKHLSQF